MGMGGVKFFKLSLCVLISLLIGCTGCQRTWVMGSNGSVEVQDGSTVEFEITSVQNSATRKITLLNTGGTTVQFSDIEGVTTDFNFVGGRFPGTDGTCGAALAGNGATCVVNLVFSPSSGGVWNQDVEIAYNTGASENSLLLSLNGEALSQGALDPAFGSSGESTSDFGYSEEGKVLLVQSDGKILLVGDSDDGSSSDRNFNIIRYSTLGTLDTTFGTGGKVSTDISSNSEDSVYSAVIQEDGKILVAGVGGNRVALARYSSGGVLDSGFGTSGISSLSNIQLGGSDVALDLVALSNGKVYDIGESFPSSGDSSFYIRRLSSVGIIDVGLPIFGSVLSPGYVLVDFGSGNNDRAQAVAVQSDGKILLAGYTDDGSKKNTAITRVDPDDGSIDTSFGSSGKVNSDLCGFSDDDVVSDIALLSAGGFVAVGTCFNGSNDDVFVAKFDSTGSLVSGFGSSGVTVVDVDGKADVAKRVTITSEEKIIVGGYTSNGTDDDFLLLRLNSDGSMDNLFGTLGVVKNAVGVSDDRANGMTLLNDGKVLLGGYSLGSDKNFAVTRHLP